MVFGLLRNGLSAVADDDLTVRGLSGVAEQQREQNLTAATYYAFGEFMVGCESMRIC